MKLQCITTCNVDGTGREVLFVQFPRRPDEKPIVHAKAKTIKEYDRIAQKNEIIQDARYWLRVKI